MTSVWVTKIASATSIVPGLVNPIVGTVMAHVAIFGCEVFTYIEGGPNRLVSVSAVHVLVVAGGGAVSAVHVLVVAGGGAVSAVHVLVVAGGGAVSAVHVLVVAGGGAVSAVHVLVVAGDGAWAVAGGGGTVIMVAGGGFGFGFLLEKYSQ